MATIRAWNLLHLNFDLSLSLSLSLKYKIHVTLSSSCLCKKCACTIFKLLFWIWIGKRHSSPRIFQQKDFLDVLHINELLAGVYIENMSCARDNKSCARDNISCTRHNFLACPTPSYFLKAGVILNFRIIQWNYSCIVNWKMWKTLAIMKVFWLQLS